MKGYFILVLLFVICYAVLSNLQETVKTKKLLEERGLKQFEVHHETKNANRTHSTESKVFAFKAEGKLGGKITFKDKEGNVVGEFDKVYHYHISY